jgi:hypothetical protein
MIGSPDTPQSGGALVQMNTQALPQTERVAVTEEKTAKPWRATEVVGLEDQLQGIVP